MAKPILDTAKFEYSMGAKPDLALRGCWHFWPVRPGHQTIYCFDVTYKDALAKLNAIGAQGITYEVLYSETNPRRVRMR